MNHAVYAHHEYEIRIRAPVLHSVLMVFLGLGLLIVAGNFVGEFVIVDLLLHLLLVCVTVAAILAVRRGRYSLASNGYFGFVLAALSILRIIEPYFGPETYAVNAGIMGGVLVATAVFVANRRVLVLFSLVAVAVSAASLVRVLTQPQTESFSLTNHVAYPTIAIVAIVVGLIVIRQTFDRILAKTAENNRELSRNAEQNRELVARSAEQMSKSQHLVANSRDTAAAGEQIHANVVSINERIQKLNSNADNALGALRNLHAAIETLDQLAENQSSHVTETTSSIEEMTASISNVAAITDARLKSIEALKTQAQQGRERVELAVRSFEGVSDKTDAITRVTGVISDIAEQTNLLAMNAAIQAAHAGEEGKGFTIVAQRIRALSESTSTNSNEIATQLAELLEAITTAKQKLDAAGGVFSAIASGVDEMANSIHEIASNAIELDSGSNEILSATNGLTTISGELKRQSGQVSEAHSTVLNDLSEVTDLTSEMAGGMNEISRGVEATKDAINTIAGLSEELQAESERLNEHL